MEAKFSGNGKWITLPWGVTIRRNIKGGAKNQSLTLTPKTVNHAIESGAINSSMTQDDIKSALWYCQKAQNRVDYAHQEAEYRTAMTAQGWIDYTELSVKSGSYRVIRQNGDSIFLGDGIEIPYTPRRWARLKSMKNIHESGLGMTAILYDKKLNEFIDFLDSTPKPIKKTR